MTIYLLQSYCAIINLLYLCQLNREDRLLFGRKKAHLFVLLSVCTIFASTNIAKMFEVVILSIVILLICLVLLCVNILCKKNGRFPNTHVGGNPALRKKGIKCVQAQDFEAGKQQNLYDRIALGVR